MQGGVFLIADDGQRVMQTARFVECVIAALQNHQRPVAVIKLAVNVAGGPTAIVFVGVGNAIQRRIKALHRVLRTEAVMLIIAVGVQVDDVWLRGVVDQRMVLCTFQWQSDFALKIGQTGGKQRAFAILLAVLPEREMAVGAKGKGRLFVAADQGAEIDPAGVGDQRDDFVVLRVEGLNVCGGMNDGDADVVVFADDAARCDAAVVTINYAKTIPVVGAVCLGCLVAEKCSQVSRFGQDRADGTRAVVVAVVTKAVIIIAQQQATFAMQGFGVNLACPAAVKKIAIQRAIDQAVLHDALRCALQSNPAKQGFALRHPNGQPFELYTLTAGVFIIKIAVNKLVVGQELPLSVTGGARYCPGFRIGKIRENSRLGFRLTIIKSATRTAFKTAIGPNQKGLRDAIGMR